jgi:hypothetical protein
MSSSFSWGRRAAAAALCMVATWSPLAAQSLIVGIPNADVTPKGAWFLTHESQVKPMGDPRGWNTFQFLTYGAGLGTELALSFVNFGRPATGNRTVALGFKTVLEQHGPSRSPWDPRATFGVMVPKSVDARGVGVWAFGSASARLPGWRTRFTIGPTYGTPQLFGVEKAGVMAGIEHPFNRHVSFVADWYSGRHDLAAAIPAVQFTLPREFVLIAGYKIPNRGAPGGHAVVLEIAGIIAR